jgi:hypothetical protein
MLSPARSTRLELKGVFDVGSPEEVANVFGMEAGVGFSKLRPKCFMSIS